MPRTVGDRGGRRRDRGETRDGPGCRCRMQPGREWKSVPKDANRNAGSGLGTDAHLTVLAMSFRRELLDEAMAGVGIERQAVWATEFGTTQGPGEGVRVIADDHILSRFLGRAMPVIDGLAGQCAMVVDDEGGRDVGQERLHLW